MVGTDSNLIRRNLCILSGKLAIRYFTIATPTTEFRVHMLSHKKTSAVAVPTRPFANGETRKIIAKTCPKRHAMRDDTVCWLLTRGREIRRLIGCYIGMDFPAENTQEAVRRGSNDTGNPILPQSFGLVTARRMPVHRLAAPVLPTSVHAPSAKRKAADSARGSRAYGSVGEELSRRIFQESFPGHRFIKTKHLPWLEGDLDDKPIRMEIDGICEDLGLAFEYNGVQHTKRVEHFHRKKGDFERQQARDRLLAAACWDNWITLIVVDHTKKPSDIRKYIRRELLALGYEPRPETQLLSIDRLEVEVRRSVENGTASYLFIKHAIESRGGHCLSEVWPGSCNKIRFSCGKGHVVKMLPNNLYNGSWCAMCLGLTPEGRADVADIERKWKVTMVNPPYINRLTVYRWKCNRRGHIFPDSWATLHQKKRHGCVHCNMEKFHLVICHDTPYTSNRSEPLHWWCQACDYQFYASFASVIKREIKCDRCLIHNGRVIPPRRAAECLSARRPQSWQYAW